jgi:hypothetical protein
MAALSSGTPLRHACLGPLQLLSEAKLPFILVTSIQSLPSAYPFVTQIIQHKFELGGVLLSKCFSEADGTTFGHVNFTAIPKDSPITKRLFFAELMLIPDLQAYKGAEPMRALHVCTIDDDSCFGKFGFTLGCFMMQ